MAEKVLAELKLNSEKALGALQKEFNRIRTGRASLGLLDGIKVDYYGTNTPLNQVASLFVPESKSILIQPWDPQVIGEIEKSILKSELGLTPINDGKVIRINIPPLTEERRLELVKVVKRMTEDCKVSLRSERREANEKLKNLKKDKKISEDDFFRLQEEVQKITDQYVAKSEEKLKDKEREILEI